MICDGCSWISRRNKNAVAALPPMSVKGHLFEKNKSKAGRHNGGLCLPWKLLSGELHRLFSAGGRTMKLLFSLVSSLLFCLGCHPNNPINQKEEDMKVKNFTESDACKALLKDLKISVDSALGKALSAERFTREGYSGNCIIETDEEQLAFNLKKKRSGLYEGLTQKQVPHMSYGESSLFPNSGKLKLTFRNC